MTLIRIFGRTRPSVFQRTRTADVEAAVRRHPCTRDESLSKLREIRALHQV